MKLLVVLAALATTTATAAAESYDATQPEPARDSYFGAALGVGGQRSLQLAVNADGGRRLGASPLFMHGQLAVGYSGSSDGLLVQARAGLEARGCRMRELVCGFAGADLGYQYEDVVEMALFGGDPYYATAHDVIAVPRVGAELGRSLKLRAIVEVPVRQQVAEVGDGNHDFPTFGAGITLALGVAYAF